MRHCYVGLCALLSVCGSICIRARADSLPDNPYTIDRQRACGVMSLAFLEAYFGGQRTYGDIVAACPPGPLGSSLQELQTMSDELGYHTRAIKGSMGTLKRLRAPVIAHCRPDKGVGHFLVILEWDEARNRFYLFDPPSSLGESTEARLGEWITGMFLVVSDKPIPQSVDGIDATGILLRLLALQLAVAGMVLLFARRKKHKSHLSGALMQLMILGFGFSIPGCDRSQFGGSSLVETADRAQEVDLGEVIEGDALETVFQIRNNGNEPFRVLRVDRSCTCQAVEVEYDVPVDCGNTRSIRVSVPTQGSEGRVSKKFDVVTDSTDARYSVIPLVLSGVVWRPLKAVPSEIMFGNVTTDSDHVKKLIVLTNPPDIATRFVAATSTDPLIIVDSRDARPGELHFHVRLAPNCPQGVIVGEIRMNFDFNKRPTLHVPFLGRRAGALSSTPARLLLSDSGSLERRAKVRITSTTGDDFAILSTECASGMLASWDDAAMMSPSHEGYITSSIDAHITNAYVYVKTSLPRDEVLRIPVSSSD